jgi:hypothetical protein
VVILGPLQERKEEPQHDSREARDLSPPPRPVQLPGVQHGGGRRSKRKITIKKMIKSRSKIRSRTIRSFSSSSSCS